ncbi:MAG: protease pro-enzyme activation domain-containing protein [Steroidobacteraceae bacterium]
MVSRSYTDFAPSHKAAPDPACKRIGDVPPHERFEVSIYLKRRDIERGAAMKSPDPRADLASRRSVQHADDFKLVQEFAKEHGLSVVAAEPAKRLIKLGGTAAQFEAAFRTKLAHYHDGKRTFRGRSGALKLPVDLHPIVESVLGLDSRPAAQPRLVFQPAAAVSESFTPNNVARLYAFPTAVTGKGQCIALIELGGGFTPADTATAFRAMGLSPPTVVAVSVDGGQNTPTPDDGADGEVALDIQVAGGAAPGARLAIYFAPNTDAGFVDAITAAVHDRTNRPTVVSISWGSAEANWTEQALQTMNTAFQDASSVNVSVFAASGDNLSADGVDDGRAHVDFPASSPWAIGCGGTSISVSGNTITGETVWNDGTSGGGGGISDVFDAPSFQENASLPPSVNDGKTRRGVPDVAANAAPGTGYRVVVNGHTEVVGGTSAVAPLWAGLTALINEGAPAPVGFFLPALYANSTLLRQITQGDNIPSGSTVGYQAGPGWNACTGLGVPNGESLFVALTQGN